MTQVKNTRWFYNKFLYPKYGSRQHLLSSHTPASHLNCAKTMQRASHLCSTGFCLTNASCSFLPLTTSPAALRRCCPTSTLASSSRCACTQPPHPLGILTNTHCLIWLDTATLTGQMTTRLSPAGKRPSALSAAHKLTLLIYSDVFHWSTYGQDLGGSFAVATQARFD
jgi:hypothetical protein